MVNVRGVNVYPAAIEAVVRGFPEIVEFRSTVSRSHEMRTLSLEIEPAPGARGRGGPRRGRGQAAARGARPHMFPCASVEPRTLPRFEMKARRFVVEEARTMTTERQRQIPTSW